MIKHVTVRELDTAIEGGDALKALLSRAYAEYRPVPFHRHFKSVAEELLVAEVDDEIIGYGMLQIDRALGDCDTITEIFVDAAYRRRGVGCVLLKALVASSPAGFVVALTPPGDVGTRCFLESGGFETREPRGVLLEDDRQVWWHIGHELRANWLLEKAAQLQLLAEQRRRWEALWDSKTTWRNEQQRRREGHGQGRLLLTGQLLDHIERVTGQGGTA